MKTRPMSLIDTIASSKGRPQNGNVAQSESSAVLDGWEGFEIQEKLTFHPSKQDAWADDKFIIYINYPAVKTRQNLMQDFRFQC